jgi:hypothetical protein
MSILVWALVFGFAVGRAKTRRAQARLQHHTRRDHLSGLLSPSDASTHSTSKTSWRGPSAAEFIESKQAPEEPPLWMLGDRVYDTLYWHDHLPTAGVVPVAPYNPRTTSRSILRTESKIALGTQRGRPAEAIGLEKTYNRRIGVERSMTRSRTAASSAERPCTSTDIPRTVSAYRYRHHQL